MGSWDWPDTLPPQCWRYRHVQSRPLFTWGLGVQTQDFTVAEEAFLPAGPPHRPSGEVSYRSVQLFALPYSLNPWGLWCGLNSFGNHFWSCWGSAGSPTALLSYSALWMFIWSTDLESRVVIPSQGARALCERSPTSLLRNLALETLDLQNKFSIKRCPGAHQRSHSLLTDWLALLTVPRSLEVLPSHLFLGVTVEWGAVCLRVPSTSFQSQNKWPQPE